MSQPAPPDVARSLESRSSRRPKLARIPAGYAIRKRPIPTRPLPTHPQQRRFYVSRSSPFLSIVKRVRQHLDRAQLARGAPTTRGLSLPQRVDALKTSAAEPSVATAEAVVVGTGAAIENVLAVASLFSGEIDYHVAARTLSVGAVDDVVDPDGALQDEARVKRLSCLEVTICLRLS